MLLSAVAIFAACVSIAPVSAAPAPIRLLVVSSIEDNSPINHLRFGHPIPPYHKPDTDLDLSSPPPLGFPVPPSYIPPPVPDKGGPVFPGGRRFRHRPGCHGRKGKLAIFMHGVKIKAIKIGNCFRKALGWPLIEVNHRHHHGHPHHVDHPKLDHDSAHTRVDGGLVTVAPGHRDWASVSHQRHNHHGTFLSRLHHSLMNLGRWEGRAVAFVIGCGIGVLVRMFWVLAIISYRACRGSRDDEYTSVAVVEVYDSDDQIVPKPEPPKYVYPVDEKIAVQETN